MEYVISVPKSEEVIVSVSKRVSLQRYQKAHFGQRINEESPCKSIHQTLDEIYTFVSVALVDSQRIQENEKESVEKIVDILIERNYDEIV